MDDLTTVSAVAIQLLMGSEYSVVHRVYELQIEKNGKRIRRAWHVMQDLFSTTERAEQCMKEWKKELK